MRVRLALTVAVIAAAAGIAVALVTRPSAAPAAGAQAVSTSASGWVLPRLGAQGDVALRDFHGRPLVLDFFASWCTACAGELPEFATVARNAGARVAFAAVDSEETGDGLGMARRDGIGGWTLARDVGGSDASGLRDSLETIPGMPVTAFYDAGGHLVHVRLGAETGAELVADVRTYLGVSLG